MKSNEQGSGLLLTLFCSLLAAMLAGLCIDATSLVWSQANLRNAADLGADAAAVERRLHPGAPLSYLQATARAAVARNTRDCSPPNCRIWMEPDADRLLVRIDKDAAVYFLRMIQAEPVSLAASAVVP